MKCEDNALNGLFSPPPKNLKNFRVGEGVILAGGVTDHFRAAYMSDSVQAQCLTEILNHAKNDGWSEEPIIYNGASFADRKSKTFTQEIRKQSITKKESKLFLGESRKLTDGVFVTLGRSEGENLLIVGDHATGDAQNPTLADALYWTLAQSFLEVTKSNHLFISLYDEDDLIARHVKDQIPKERLTIATDMDEDDLGQMIFTTYRKLKNLQATTSKEEVKNIEDKHILILTKAEQLRKLATWKEHQEEEASPTTTPVTVAPTPSNTGKSRFDLGALTESTAPKITATPQRKEATVNAAEALKDILHSGGKYGFHVVICSRAITVAMQNLELRQTELQQIFPHIICLPMSADDSQKCIGSAKANQLGKKLSLYWNALGGDPEKFRPYFPGTETSIANG